MEIVNNTRDFTDGFIALKHVLENAKGNKIETGFYPNIPKDEKWYVLQDVKVSEATNGGYIVFYLKEGNDIKEFVINQIKSYNYNIFPDGEIIKYWLTAKNNRSNESDTYRFLLKVK